VREFVQHCWYTGAVAPPEPLGEFEQLVLLAVLRTSQDDGQAYGISVYDELIVRTGRRVARGAVYMTLDRLEKKGLLTSYVTAPTADRGGRARRCYRVTRTATAALRASRTALQRLWEGLELKG
jgi:PadR family transcriptional regulator PadR